MIFGSLHDWTLLQGITRALLRNVVEQDILYYKLSLEETHANLYGEAVEKVYWEPVKLNCLITRGDQVITDDEFGPDLTRSVSFAFLRDDLVEVNTVPEVGDIVMWHENYYEVGTVRENQLFIGKDNQYNLTDYGHKFGASISIIVDCHLTRADKVGITQAR